MKVTVNVKTYMSWGVVINLLSGFVFAPTVVWRIWFGTHDWVLDFFLTVLVIGWAVDQITKVVVLRTSYWQDRRDAL